MNNNTNSKIFASDDMQSGVNQQNEVNQEKLFKELQNAVKKHYQYLHRLETQSINTPKWYLVMKRVIDVSYGILAWNLLFPLFFVIALLIKIDSSGPVFFSQVRVGKNGKLFKRYKFRTMVVDTENNPKITFIGRFLRYSNMDELPQLLNLIKGEMSIVGPRPEEPFYVDQFIKIIPGYFHRLDVNPGLTGPAQIQVYRRNANAMDVIKELRYDITYIKKMSLSMDLRIMTKTLLSVIRDMPFEYPKREIARIYSTRILLLYLFGAIGILFGFLILLIMMIK
jgi:lipopolysaccharide/colanic/teichoic acid biosynthesis glycosyltransferase